MTTAYEAVRADALRAGAETAPSGGAGVIMRSGVPTWLTTWAPSPPPPPECSRSADLPSVVSALHADLVLVLASMALGHASAVHP